MLNHQCRGSMWSLPRGCWLVVSHQWRTWLVTGWLDQSWSWPRSGARKTHTHRCTCRYYGLTSRHSEHYGCVSAGRIIFTFISCRVHHSISRAFRLLIVCCCYKRPQHSASSSSGSRELHSMYRARLLQGHLQLNGNQQPRKCQRSDPLAFNQWRGN